MTLYFTGHLAVIDTPHGPDQLPTHRIDTGVLGMLHSKHVIDVTSAYDNYYWSYFTPIPRCTRGKRLSYTELKELETMTHELSHIVRAGLELEKGTTCAVSAYFRILHNTDGDTEEIETAAAQILVLDAMFPNERSRERIRWSCRKNLRELLPQDVDAKIAGAMTKPHVQANADTLLAYYLSNALLIPEPHAER